MSITVATALMLVGVAVLVRTPQPRVGSTRARDGPLEKLRRRILATARPQGEATAGAQDLDVFAACLRSGLGPHQVARCLATYGRLPVWATVSALLEVGASPETAWGECASIPGLEELAAIVRNSHRSGASMATNAAELAASLRERGQHQAQAAAARAGVLIALPLTLCFLPAFILIGLLPILVELGIGILQ